MQSRWVDRDAKAAVDRYAAAGIAPDLALRIYTTRLLGGDPALVLHGGGNTSVKTRMRDLAGDEVEVLCVKGTGGDMATIEPAGMVAVRLAPLQQLRTRDDLSDDDMARVQRANLLDPMAPNPSVGTAAACLHAAQVRRPHPRQCGAEPDRPAGRREACATRSMAAASASCPTCVPGFGLAKAAAGDVRRRIRRSKG